jgi:serine/threonine protein kinase
VDGVPRAIKIITGAHSPESVTREFESLNRMKHRNIVGIYGVGCMNDAYTSMYLIMELGMKNLSDMVRENETFFLSDNNLESCLFDLSKALSYLEDQNLLHQDIKPDNVLVCRPEEERQERACTFKLADFGLAIKLNAHGYHAEPSKFGGTWLYMAPEVLKKAFQAEIRTSRTRK